MKLLKECLPLLRQKVKPETDPLSKRTPVVHLLWLNLPSSFNPSPNPIYCISLLLFTLIFTPFPSSQFQERPSIPYHQIPWLPSNPKVLCHPGRWPYESPFHCTLHPKGSSLLFDLARCLRPNTPHTLTPESPSLHCFPGLSLWKLPNSDPGASPAPLSQKPSTLWALLTPKGLMSPSTRYPSPQQLPPPPFSSLESALHLSAPLSPTNPSPSNPSLT
jgi:hypothetical protein